MSKVIPIFETSRRYCFQSCPSVCLFGEGSYVINTWTCSNLFSQRHAHFCSLAPHHAGTPPPRMGWKVVGLNSTPFPHHTCSRGSHHRENPCLDMFKLIHLDLTLHGPPPPRAGWKVGGCASTKGPSCSLSSFSTSLHICTLHAQFVILRGGYRIPRRRGRQPLGGANIQIC